MLPNEYALCRESPKSVFYQALFLNLKSFPVSLEFQVFRYLQFELASAKRRSELGPVIGQAKREGRDSDADRWLAGQDDLNEIGKGSTHDFALPSSKDMSRSGQ